MKRTRRTREDYSLQRRARRRRSRRPAVRIRRSSVIFILPRTIFRVTSPIGPGSLPKAAVPSLTEICTGGVAVPCSAQIFSVIAAVCPDSSGDGTPLRCLLQHDASRTHNACAFHFPPRSPPRRWPLCCPRMHPSQPFLQSGQQIVVSGVARETPEISHAARARPHSRCALGASLARPASRCVATSCPFFPLPCVGLTRFAAPPGVKNNTQFCQRTAV